MNVLILNPDRAGSTLLYTITLISTNITANLQLGNQSNSISN
jgi:hypothetical protein